MARPVLILLLAGLGCLRPMSHAAGIDRLHVGPIYTTAVADAKNPDGASPLFPQMEILLDPGEAGTSAASDFRLSIDGKDSGAAKKLRTFETTGHGVAAAFTIDVSGSMKGGPLDAIRKGLARFADDAKPRDRIALQTVADEGRWDAPWNAPPAQLRSALANLTSRGKLTRIWDAVAIALASFPEQPMHGHLIVISDGHDEGSQHTEGEVITLARHGHVVIDSVGVTRSDPAYLRALESLSTETGGHYQRAANEGELENSIARGIRSIRALPVGLFEAQDVKADGLIHRFQITLKHAGTETVGTLTSRVPKANPEKAPSHLWIFISAGVGAPLLALILFFLFRQRKAPAVVSIPATASPASAAAPPVFRSATALRPPPPRAFAGGAVAAPRVERASAVEPSQPAPARQPAKTQIAVRYSQPSTGHPCAWLHCESGMLAGADFPIEAIEYWLGGLTNNHLSLDEDPTVSANHACIVFEQGSLGILDNDSTNGTWVNEQRIAHRRQLLWPGDRIRIGRFIFVLVVNPSRNATV